MQYNEEFHSAKSISKADLYVLHYVRKIKVGQAVNAVLTQEILTRGRTKH